MRVKNMACLGESLFPRVKNLPDDLVMEIVTRLPLKPYLRFKCVSKLFCALVDSLYYKRKHHNHVVKSKTNDKIIVNSGYYSYHSIDLNLLDQALKLEPPLKSDISDGTILGSDHGLLCIQVSAIDIIIWNPTTRLYHKVPEAFDYYIQNCDHSIFHGFGYDPVSDDYKILRINQFWDSDISSYKSETAVYSSRSNSWQFLQDFPYYISHFNDARCGTLICGELLWCVNSSYRCRNSILIAAFDLATNNFSLVDHPDALNDEFNMTSDKFFDITLSELGGNLCVMCDYMDAHVDVWVMKNYRVKESWTKLFSISKHGQRTSFYPPLSYSNKEDEIMLLNEDKELFCYNLKEKVPKAIKVRDCPYINIQMATCVDSLAPPDGRWR